MLLRFSISTLMCTHIGVVLSARDSSVCVQPKLCKCSFVSHAGGALSLNHNNGPFVLRSPMCRRLMFLFYDRKYLERNLTTGMIVLFIFLLQMLRSHFCEWLNFLLSRVSSSALAQVSRKSSTITFYSMVPN